MSKNAAPRAVRYTMFDTSGGRHKLIYVLADQADPGMDGAREEFFTHSKGSRYRYALDAPIEREEFYN